MIKTLLLFPIVWVFGWVATRYLENLEESLDQMEFDFDYE